MKFLVAYDGSPLSKSALLRAADFAETGDATVHAVTIVPEDGALARERGWIGVDGAFDIDRIETAIRGEVRGFIPDARVHAIAVEKHAAHGRITRKIRSLAREIGARVLFVGSESAGHLVTGLSSVGQGVAYGEYDLHVVRRPHPIFT
jgi:nucleotide-binding universal stress UspA family protein